jgi:hypothetical protein
MSVVAGWALGTLGSPNGADLAECGLVGANVGTPTLSEDSIGMHCLGPNSGAYYRIDAWI